jgi:thiol peroxidase
MNNTNKNLTFKNNPMPVEGAELKIGDKLPSFTVTGNDMSPITTGTFAGKPVIVSLIPSLDTPVCAIETARFNKEVNEFIGKASFVTISADLPFAQSRWCAAEGATNVVTASSYRNTKELGTSFGAYITAMGLLARSVFVADKNGIIQHVEYVKELAEEPQYEAVLKKVRELL